MIAQRVLEIINLSRVPERYKRLWPQHAAVFVSIEGEIIDVVQCYSTTEDTVVEETHALYPGTAYFLADVGMYQSEEEIDEKVQSCVEALNQPRGKSGARLKIKNKWIQSLASKIDFGED